MKKLSLVVSGLVAFLSATYAVVQYKFADKMSSAQNTVLKTFRVSPADEGKDVSFEQLDGRSTVIDITVAAHTYNKVR